MRKNLLIGIIVICTAIIISSIALAMTSYQQETYNKMDNFWSKLKYGYSHGLFGVFTAWGEANCCSTCPVNGADLWADLTNCVHDGQWVQGSGTVYTCSSFGISTGKCSLNVWYQDNISSHPSEPNWNNWYGEITSGSWTVPSYLWYFVQVYSCPSTPTCQQNWNTQVKKCENGVWVDKGSYSSTQSCSWDTSGIGLCWCNAQNEIFYIDYSGNVHCVTSPSSSWCYTCTDTSWTPDTSTICSGTSFIQTSNCGNTKTSTGTKSCGTCTPDNSCASNTCIGSTCINNCGTTIQGTKSCGNETPNPLEPPTCIDDQGIFYTNGYAIIGKGNFKFLGYSSQTTSGDASVINTKDLQSVIPGLSAKYFENRLTTCCGELKSYFEDEKSFQYSRTDFDLFKVFGTNYISKILSWFGVEKEDDITRISVTYSVYKCVPKEEVGFCLEVAHKWLNPFTHADDCQTNTIIFAVLIIFAFIIISRFAGG